MADLLAWVEGLVGASAPVMEQRAPQDDLVQTVSMSNSDGTQEGVC